MTADGVPLSRDSAWNFLYRYCLAIDNAGVPHIVESNVLEGSGWRRRANRVAAWLERNLVPGRVLSVDELKDKVDKAWKIARDEYHFRPNARSNVAGSALENALAFLIERFCGTRPLVKSSIREFRGFELARAAEVDELDLALFSFADFRLFISTVWTTRKDRIASDLYEAAFLRKRRPDVAIAFVVNEFHTSLIGHLQSAPEVDRIYHGSLPALLEAHRPLKRDDTPFESPLASKEASAAFSTYLNLQEQIQDLASLFRDIDRIKPP